MPAGLSASHAAGCKYRSHSLPGLEQVRLGLINANYQTGPLAREVMHAVIARPAYWAFCWGSGLSLARWLLANPEEVVDQIVLDFGPGSGIVAIAAAIAGAREVWACDNDADALRASAVNAQLNGVDIQLVSDLSTAPFTDESLTLPNLGEFDEFRKVRLFEWDSRRQS